MEQEKGGMTISQVVRKVESTLESFQELYSSHLEEDSTKPFIIDNLRDTQKKQVPIYFETLQELEEYLLIFIQNTDENSARYSLLLEIFEKLQKTISSLPPSLYSSSNPSENSPDNSSDNNNNNNNNENLSGDENNDNNNDNNDSDSNDDNNEKDNLSGNENENEIFNIQIDNDNENNHNKNNKKNNNNDNNNDNKKWNNEKECQICYGSYLKDQFFSPENCIHSYCLDCTRLFIILKIDEGDVENIKLCNEGCNSFYTVYDIQSLVPYEKYVRFEKFSILAQLRRDETSRFCPRCETARSGEAEQLKITCKNCQQEYCFDCKVVWHENMSCAEQQKILFKERKKNEIALKKIGAKKCPHCGTHTVRNHGCPDMACTVCYKNWNWYYDDPNWQEDGFFRKDETLLEKVAFYYSRGVKYQMGSRDIHGDNNSEEYNKALIEVAVLGVVGIPITVVCGPPAVAIRSARKLKNKLKKKSKNNI